MTDQLSGTQPASVRIFGKAESAPAYAIRDFLHRGDVPFEWTELKNDEQAREIGVEISVINDCRSLFFPDGTRMEAPTIRQITEKLGWFRDPSRSEYDLAIYGAGPAGSVRPSTGLLKDCEQLSSRDRWSEGEAGNQFQDRELSWLSARHQRC